ncbi:MAG: hypothetical protein KC983_12465 [Phycisphaerales bacterium]|nr:hypothetical protein [Phycisphaerales bacterium]
MPVPEFHGLQPGATADLAKTLHDICTRGDRAAWSAWYDRFANIAPMECRMLPNAAPITQRSVHTGEPDVLRGVVPAAGSIDWMLAQYVRTQSPQRFSGLCDGFNGTFLDGMNVQSLHPSPACRAVFDQYRDRLLAPIHGVPEAVAFLRHGDAFCTYLECAALRALLRADDAAGFMPWLTEALSSETWGIGFARGLVAWKDFMHSVADASHDLFYMEFVT